METEAKRIDKALGALVKSNHFDEMIAGITTAEEVLRELDFTVTDKAIQLMNSYATMHDCIKKMQEKCPWLI